MADSSRIGSQLRHFRKKRGWTQSELAERSGLKRTALGAYEEGRAEPRLAALVRLARDPAQRARLGQRARAKMRGHDWTDVAERVLGLCAR